jgi:hypothetical protein
MRRLFIILLIMIFTGGPTARVWAGIMGGTDLTPTSYDIHITQIEFQNDDGDWIVFYAGARTFDIASTTPGSDIDQLAAGTTLPVDTYSAIRVTFDDSFGLTGVGNHGGERMITQTGNPADQTFAGPGLTGIGRATKHPVNPPTKQAIPLPQGGTMPALLAGAGITDLGGQLQLTRSVDFTIIDSNTLPTIQIKVNITNSMEIRYNAPNQYLVIPLPPSIDIIITNP